MSQCYIPNPNAIGFFCLREKDFKGFILYMGLAAILDIVTKNILQTPFPYPK